VSAAAMLRRLEQLGQRYSHGNARTITITVPTRLTPIESSTEMDAHVTDETRAEIDRMLLALDVTEHDTVIEIARYTDTVPELISIT
jgi:hypothetical protein